MITSYTATTAIGALFSLVFLSSSNNAYGYYDPTDSEAVDQHNMCLQLASTGACNSDPLVMESACTEVCAETRFNDQDKLPQCNEAAMAGQCLTNSQNMWRECPQTCKTTKGIRKFEMVRLTDPVTGVTRNSFFGLSATKGDGEELYFDEYEGSITLVVNIANMPDVEQTKQFYQELETMKQTYPKHLEIFAFPFRLPNTPPNYVGYSHFSKNIHIMKEVNVYSNPDNNADTSEQHPLYRYFQNIFGYDDLETTFPTWFLINNVGGIVEAHHGGDPSTVMVFVENHIDYDIKGKVPDYPKQGESLLA